ncbi:T9SS type A sorting domain-containing protein [Rhizosphaericola mali]|uniref:T9SS type A sorting domain-containing protein n=1 Tax=Rhizosphaericola mali TaxID=2545455 RepID=A0A5P2G888_9BACT|nr:T9SS type A sorting domain-containing protein [Rhizosphaericola mali]QES89970.1 T9SS type A sorting domain-containing protein [Rhizosphaericola mali]
MDDNNAGLVTNAASYIYLMDAGGINSAPMGYVTRTKITNDQFSFSDLSMLQPYRIYALIVNTDMGTNTFFTSTINNGWNYTQGAVNVEPGNTSSIGNSATNGLFSIATNQSNITNVQLNFGIQQIPQATSINNTSMLPWMFSLTNVSGYKGILAGNTYASMPTGTDNDGNIQSFTITSVDPDASDNTTTKIYYDGAFVNLPYTIASGSDPNLLGFYGLSSQNGVSFKYYVTDNAGANSSIVKYLLKTPAGTTLPITLSSFTLHIVENMVSIDWNTINEINTKTFEILRSTSNQKTWENITSIPAAGNSTSTKTYNYVDKNPHLGEVYYRLKETDMDGNNNWSNILSIYLPNTNNTFVIYPNPIVNGIANLKLPTINGGNGSLINLYGIVVKNFTFPKNSNVFNLNISDITKGVYFVKIIANGKNYTSKLIVE